MACQPTAPRSLPYRAGSMLLGLSLLLGVVCFAVPFWFNATGFQSAVAFSVNGGLWMKCQSGGSAAAEGCNIIDFAKAATWSHGVRALQGVGVLFQLIACIILVSLNCCGKYRLSYSQAGEIIAGLGGLCGFAGCCIYIGYMEFAALNWGFYLACIAHALTVVAAILVSLGNDPLDLKAADTSAILPGSLGGSRLRLSQDHETDVDGGRGYGGYGPGGGDPRDLRDQGDPRDARRDSRDYLDMTRGPRGSFAAQPGRPLPDAPDPRDPRDPRASDPRYASQRTVNGPDPYGVQHLPQPHPFKPRPGPQGYRSNYW